MVNNNRLATCCNQCINVEIDEAPLAASHWLIHEMGIVLSVAQSHSYGVNVHVGLQFTILHNYIPWY